MAVEDEKNSGPPSRGSAACFFIQTTVVLLFRFERNRPGPVKGWSFTGPRTVPKKGVTYKILGIFLSNCIK